MADDDDKILAYLRNMREGNEWADEEIIVALSMSYQLHIVILMKNSVYVHEVGEIFERCVYMVYYNNLHYNSVQPLGFVPSENSLTQV